MRKRLLQILSIVLLVVLFSSFVLAEAKPITEVVKTAFTDLFNLASLSDAGSGENRMVGFIRIAIGILIFTICMIGLRFISDHVPKNMAIAIAIVISIISSVFIPGSVLSAIAAGYAVFFSFIIYGSMLFPPAYFLFAYPTSNRAIAGLKLGILALVSWLIALVNDAAVGLTGASQTGAFPNMGEFGQWVEQLSSYAYVIILGLAVYLIYQLIKGGDDTPASAWGAGAAGAGRRAWRAVSPHLKGTRANSRRARRSLVNQFVTERDEFNRIEDLRDRVGRLEAERTTLIGLPADARNTRSQFRRFQNNVDEAANECVRIIRRFRSVNKNTFRHQREINRLIREARTSRESLLGSTRGPASTSVLTRLRTNENQILSQHRNTLQRARRLLRELQAIQRNARSAANQLRRSGVPSSPSSGRAPTSGRRPLSPLAGAQAVLRRVSFTNARTLVNQMFDIQGDRGVMQLIQGIMTDLDRV